LVLKHESCLLAFFPHICPDVIEMSLVKQKERLIVQKERRKENKKKEIEK
jgi:hypothetical protein